MLEVPDVQSIRALAARGIGVREIARTLHVSRKTVRKYASRTWVVEPEPKQRLAKARPSPRMDRWKPVLQAWVDQDEAVARKQRRTARRMYQQLVSEYQATVSEASVRRHVAALRGARSREAYVPLTFPLGSMVQVDFGHAGVTLAGASLQLPFVAMRLMASSASFVKVFTHQKLEAWLDGISSGLSFFGGVPAKATFDNDGAFVREILAGGKRLQTPEFRALMAHFGMEAVFANPGRGNEKGGVEHLVQWAQRNLFSPVPMVGSLGDLNERLVRAGAQDAYSRKRDGRVVNDLWALERGHLAPLPGVPFQACRRRFVRVDKTLLVRYDGVAYSVPAEYAQKPGLLLRAFWDRIEIAAAERTVAVHERRSPGSPPSLQLAHYLPALERKPRAVTHAAVIAQADEIARYRDAFLAAIDQNI